MKVKNSYIPKHLKQYIVEQDYSNYNFIDHACWRYIMKISIDFFSLNADSIYKEGLKKTGITIEKIPKINSINKKLKQFGWNAVCVRGFIPPQIFMEFQSLKILPIAADMRNHKHLTYTPAPDIVHEAAGHAPIIANKDYSKYLMDYGEIASKAIISHEDMNLYFAIRDLSDAKEDVKISKYKLKKLENNLKNAYNNLSYVSESSMLSRMNWWTVEYGLVGNIKNPKIYGAGLLSSVGESENCLSNNVIKKHLNINCIKYPYDITEQQPQLFVTPSYKYLRLVLKNLSKKMSYKIGGDYGLDNAIKAKTICSIEIDQHIYVSGIVENYILNNKDIVFIKLKGASQISYNKKEIEGHGINYHRDGYSSPIGKLKKIKKNINTLNTKDIKLLNIKDNEKITLEFLSGIIVTGTIKKIYKKASRIILITFINCLVSYNKKILFKPEWGNFDLICGEKITSVFGGITDKISYYKNIKIKKIKYNKFKKVKYNKELNLLYKNVKDIRNKKKSNRLLKNIYKKICNKYNSEWLIKYEIFELSYNKIEENWVSNLYKELQKSSLKNNDTSRAIKRGLSLILK